MDNRSIYRYSLKYSFQTIKSVAKYALLCYNKLTDKPVTVCQELFEKIQIKKGVTTKPKSSNNFEC